MPVGRLFYEISGDTSKLNASLKQAMDTMQAAGVKATAAGQRFISAFDEAINPTKRYEEQLKLLQAAGKSTGDIMAVMGDKLKAAAQVADKNKQPVSDYFRSFTEGSKQSAISIESLGQSIMDFARNPVQAAQAGITGMLTKMGPLAVGLGSIATAAAAAGTAIFNMYSEMAAGMEQMENLSAITGIATQDLEAYTRMAKEAGLEGMDLGRVIGRINEQLGDSKPNDFTKGLKSLGIEIKDASGKTKDAVSILDELRLTLLAIEDPTQRSQIAMNTLGVRYREVIPLLVNAKKSLADMRQEMIDAGITTDEFSKQQLLALDAALDRAGRNVEGFWHKLKLGALEFIGSGGRALPFAFMIPDIKATSTAVEDLETRSMRLLKIYDAMVASKFAEENKKASEAAKKLADEVAKLGDKYTKTTGSIYDAVDAMEAWLKKTQEAGHADFLKESEKAAKDLKTTMDELSWSATEAMSKTDKAWFKGAADELPKFTADVQRSMDDVLLVNRKTGDSVAEIWKRQVSTIATDFSKGFADILFAGKGFAQSLKDIFVEMGKSIVRALIETLFVPLQRYLVQILGGLLSVGSASASTGGGGMAGFGGLAGLGGLAGIAGGAGGLAAMLMPGGFAGKVAGGLGVGTLAGAGALYGGLIPGMGAASFGSAASFMSSGAGLFGAGGLLGMGAMTVPVIGAAAIGLYYGIKALIGQSTQGAGSKEVTRDLGINVGKNQIESFIGQYIKPSEAWGIRKDLLSSPAFLTQVAGPAAQAQGRMEEFLTSLEQIKTSWGTFNFRQAFEVGQTTGDWTQLNEAFKAAFASSEELRKMLPDWETKLMAVSDATKGVKTENDLLIESITGLRDAIAGSITPLESMYDKFLATGEITEEFAAQIEKLGGNIQKFRDLADMVGRQTALKDQLGFLNDLVGRFQSLQPAATAIEDLFKGIINTEGLLAKGLDPNKFKSFADLQRSITGWDQAVAGFQQTGKLDTGGILSSALASYGGDPGRIALERLSQGFNTITPGLLSDTYTKMQEAYQKEVTSVLDYLASLQEQTTEQIAVLDDSINLAKQDIVTVLNAILLQLGGTPTVTGNEAGTGPTVATGAKQTIVINGPVYGFDDFAAQVERAGILLQRRGSAVFAT